MTNADSDGGAMQGVLNFLPGLLFGGVTAGLSRVTRDPTRTVVPVLVCSTLFFHGVLYVRGHLDGGGGSGGGGGGEGGYAGALAAATQANWLFDVRALSSRQALLWASRRMRRARVRWDVLPRACGGPVASLCALGVMKASLLYPAYNKAFPHPARGLRLLRAACPPSHRSLNLHTPNPH